MSAEVPTIEVPEDGVRRTRSERVTSVEAMAAGLNDALAAASARIESCTGAADAPSPFAAAFATIMLPLPGEPRPRDRTPGIIERLAYHLCPRFTGAAPSTIERARTQGCIEAAEAIVAQ